jgi:serine/threonine protein kinase
MKDFFVSYNQHDCDWGEWIAWQLEEAGFSVEIQAWDFRPGENFVLNMHRASLARTTIAVLSPTYLSSLYTQPEWAAALARDPTSTDRALLPVRVRECELAGLLATIVFVDLVGLDPVESRARLLAAAQGERAKPAIPPGFPGAGRASPAFPSLPPRPNCRDQFTREVSEQAESLRKRRRELLIRGTAEEAQAVERSLLELKRQLREGPRLKAGDCLSNRYALLEELGSGGFATVWHAYDEETNQHVALKVLHGQYSDSAERRDRFWRGARAMQRLGRHPHIVHILDPHQEDRGYQYFVMEHVAGGTFMEAVTIGAMKAEKHMEVILAIGDALSFAHKQGILHRDVTPDNILLDAPGGAARLADFDLVRLPDSTGGTRTGALGKYIYAAPESMESADDVDQRCDVFSLGMTAVFSFYGKKLPQTVLRNWHQFIDGLACPSAIKAVLVRATDHEREKRYGTMKAFCDALCEALAGAPSTCTVPGPPTPPPDRAADQVARGALVNVRALPEAPPPDRGEAQGSGNGEGVFNLLQPEQWDFGNAAPAPIAPAPTSGDAIRSEPGSAGDSTIDPAPSAIAPAPSTCEPSSGGGNASLRTAFPLIPGYEILEELGRGGMGSTYLARQLSLQRLVAVKMSHDGRHAYEDHRARFEKEAMAVATLKHTNIVQIYDFGSYSREQYIVMEHVEGGSLHQLLHGGAGILLPPRPSAELMEQVARAVAFAHQHGIIHRDLKPANILLAPSPNQMAGSRTKTSAASGPSYGVPKVTDFGLVLRLDQGDSDVQGVLIGTPSYMAPEQAAGRNNEIGPASDVWSLGATLYEMLTGRPPFRAESVMDTLVEVMNGEPIQLRHLRPNVPGVLAAICMKCLQKDIGQRYASAAALADDLRCYLDGRRPSVSPSFWRSLLPW